MTVRNKFQMIMSNKLATRKKKQRTNDFNDKNSSCVAVLIGPFFKVFK